jgi:hypothetical protein
MQTRRSHFSVSRASSGDAALRLLGLSLLP